MLWLSCTIGGDRFVLDAKRVTAVLPAIVWKRVVGAPHGVVGLVNYHQTPVPLLDLSMLFFGTPSALRMHTRIIMVQTILSAPAPERPLLGLLAEGSVETLRHDFADFVPPDDVATTAPYLGPIFTDESGIVQRIEIDALLAPSQYTPLLESCNAA